MTEKKPLRLGVLVNPFAGIGGALALKGSDGAKIREKALAQGAQKLAKDKMTKALTVLAESEAAVQIKTVAGEMGADSCDQSGLPFEVIFTPANKQTEAQDTEQAARLLIDSGIDVLLFAGGDGTARNICNAVRDKVPVLGVPAGCKIHSGVYAVTPSAAGQVVALMAKGELVSEMEGEVRDIDEDAFRAGKVLARHFGDMRVPAELSYIQAVKMGGREHEELVIADIVAHVLEVMEDLPEAMFVMGSGTTVAAIMEHLALPNTLLGVDIIKNGELVASDVTAQTLLSLTQTAPTKLVITVIGGQGHILGRGNQQLSPAFLHRIGKENMLVIATKQKLQQLEGRPLRLDSGDSELDALLAGHLQVITGYHDKVLYPVV
ncbi:ATP-NAD kinase family protein [Alteromonas pelagimontana]|uniref:ATP-NAD kinase family protein n=1 Tax=Alteromonas pelagimontana TaxID=1858656 RepID=A0A6M4MGA7_9ALTE|nr:ATP-NAD kinase family protein [Alteromonas pelagimontana]QJR82221.1 ATP-NAD kinase family protein [Alteromonas pelagimontana]